MDNNETPISPISGEAIPYKDLKEEGMMVNDTRQNTDKKKKNPFVIVAIILVGIIVILSLLVSLKNSKNQTETHITPTPTTTPIPTTSNQQLESETGKKVQILEKKIDALEVEDLDLSFPQVDWEIEF